MTKKKIGWLMFFVATALLYAATENQKYIKMFTLLGILGALIELYIYNEEQKEKKQREKWINEAARELRRMK